MTIQEAWTELLNTPLDTVFEAVGAFTVGFAIVMVLAVGLFVAIDRYTR